MSGSASRPGPARVSSFAPERVDAATLVRGGTSCRSRAGTGQTEGIRTVVECGWTTRKGARELIQFETELGNNSLIAGQGTKPMNK